jgi:hypothetical protein
LPELSLAPLPLPPALLEDPAPTPASVPVGLVEVAALDADAPVGELGAACPLKLVVPIAATRAIDGATATTDGTEVAPATVIPFKLSTVAD